MASHKTLTGTNLHSPFHYVQESDPGAVGANLLWLKASTGVLKYRNSGNTAWTTILAPTYEGGAPLPNTVILDPGTTWTQLKAAVAAADPGTIMYLPDETIDVDDGVSLSITKNLTLLGSGPLSKIKHTNDVSSFGSGIVVGIYAPSAEAPVTAVRLANFTLECDRAASDPGTRSTLLVLHGSYSLSGVEIDHIHFETCSASSVVVTGEDISDVYFHHNLFNEFYEQGIEVGSLASNFVISDNTFITTVVDRAFHDGQTAFAIILDIEREPSGLCDNFVIANNTIDFSGLNSEDGNGAMGIRCSQGQTGRWRYDHVLIHKNTIIGCHYGIELQGLHGGPALDPGLTTDLIFSLNFFNFWYNNDYPYYALIPDGDDQPDWSAGFPDDGLAFTSHGGSSTTGPVDGVITDLGAQLFVAASEVYFDRASEAALQTGNINFTVDALVLLSSKPANPMIIICKYASGQAEYAVDWYNTDDRFRFRVSTDGSDEVNVVASSAGAPALDTWYHVRGWHDATNNEIGISVNGVANTKAHSTGVHSGSGAVEIGRRGDANYWNGKMCCLNFWKRVITRDQDRLGNEGFGMPYATLASEGDRSILQITQNNISESRAACISLVPGGAETYADKILIADNTLTRTGSEAHILYINKTTPQVTLINNRLISNSTPIYQLNEVPNCLAWWDAQSITANHGDLISTWEDLVGGHHFTSSGANRPSYVVNFLSPSAPIVNGLHFANTFDDYMVVNDLTLTQPCTIVLRFYIPGGVVSGDRMLFGGDDFNMSAQVNNLADPDDYISAYAGTAFGSHEFGNTLHSLIVVYNGASSIIRLDGNETTGHAGGSGVTAGNFAIGRSYEAGAVLSSFGPFFGYMCEMGIFSGIVSSADRANIDTYLSARWSTPGATNWYHEDAEE